MMRANNFRSFADMLMKTHLEMVKIKHTNRFQTKRWIISKHFRHRSVQEFPEIQIENLSYTFRISNGKVYPLISPSTKACIPFLLSESRSCTVIMLWKPPLEFARSIMRSHFDANNGWNSEFVKAPANFEQRTQRLYKGYINYYHVN